MSACLAVLIAGCGSGGDSSTPTIDPATIEPELLNNLAQDAGIDPSGFTMDCPSGEPAVEGQKFDCTIVGSDGDTKTVNVTVTDVTVSGDQVNYHVEGVVPK
jgi:Domain of unknown function (DUF4333)